MKASERRRRILDIFLKKGSLCYEEILYEMSDLGNEEKILNDMDNLVFFRFLEHLKESKNKLKLRSVTEKQMKDNIKRIDQRLSKIVYEISPWYRKLTILTILDDSPPSDAEEILNMLATAMRFPQSPQVVTTSLKILESHTYVSRMEKELHKFKITDKGRNLLMMHPLEKALELKKLEDEFADEFKTFVILDIVRKHGKIGRGISTGRIIAVLQKEYGRRGNNRRAVRKKLDNMAYCDLLNASEDKRGSMGGSYTLGGTALAFFGITPMVNPMNMHIPIADFKETVEQFFNNYEIRAFPVEKKLHIKKILDFLEQYEQNMEIAPRDLWVSHIDFLSTCLRNWKGISWEESETRCIIACILSRLLPSNISVHRLREFSPPLPSEKQYHRQIGIAREYYFKAAESYLKSGNYEEALRSFDHLESLSWKSPEFLILKGIIEMLRCDVRKPGEFEKVMKIFEEAVEMSKKEKKVIAIFQKGLAYYQRGYYKEAGKTWEKCLESKLFDNQKIILNHNLANAYSLSGHLEKAKTLYEKTVETAKNLNMEKYRVNALVSLTDVLIDLCLWDEAEEKLKEIFKVCGERQFARTEALAKANMGTLLTKKGDCEKALFYLEEAVKLGYNVCDPYEYGSILIHLGDTFRKLQMIDEAMDVYDETLQLIDKSDLELMLAAEIRKADLYIERGDFDRSLELSKAVLEEAWLDDRRSRAEAHRIQGKVYLLKKDFYKAKECLEESEKIFVDLKLQYELLEVYELLELCCKTLKDGRETYYKNERENIQKRIGLL
ncbi:MAG: tetratricopeptide repeat protein [Theionarchaea archaeon]|nr:tetratricopeptide repeat protein [Theionarchaea archaeon]